MKTLYSLLIIFFCLFSAKGQSNEIAAFFTDSVKVRQLHYPKSVFRFYSAIHFQNAWTKTLSVNDQRREAIALLKEAYKYGLSPADYLRSGYSFSKITSNGYLSPLLTGAEVAAEDVFLTDAFITFISHLHFGKFNPQLPKSEIDAGGIDDFSADAHLLKAYDKPDFTNAILKAQPQLKAYSDLQQYLESMYTSSGGSLDNPEVSKVLINMERLRWIGVKEPTFVLVNIPSYTLEFHQGEQVSDFKVIVGKPSTKSPQLKSTITHFTTAPDWNVPESIYTKEMLSKILKNRSYLNNNHYQVIDKKGQKVSAGHITRSNAKNFRIRQTPGSHNALGAVVFRFPNTHGVYLHDTSQKKLFNNQVRALSHGCIRLDNAKQFAVLLLKQDQSASEIPLLEKAMTKYTRKDFVLKNPVPIVVTYLTYAIKDGEPIGYKDLYNLDKALENRFNSNK